MLIAHQSFKSADVQISSFPVAPDRASFLFQAARAQTRLQDRRAVLISTCCHAARFQHMGRFCFGAHIFSPNTDPRSKFDPVQRGNPTSPISSPAEAAANPDCAINPIAAQSHSPFSFQGAFSTGRHRDQAATRCILSPLSPSASATWICATSPQSSRSANVRATRNVR